MIAIYDYRKPTVAAVAGIAPGYGMDLANMCDVTIASKNAQFVSTQVKYAMNGFCHGTARKVGAQRARRILFAGDPISAEEAYRVGLVDELASMGQVRAIALKLAKNIAEAGSDMTTVLKEVARWSNNRDHVGANAYELRVTSDPVQRKIYSHDQGRVGKETGKENSSLGEALSSISCMPPATGDRVFRD
ncbi:enoyl-CoA hydratase [Ilyonectria robusta]